MGAAEFELAINRRLTDAFIATDPTTLVLIPNITVPRPGGAKRVLAGTPREPQDFKFIYPGGDGIVVTDGGTTRRFDFIVVGSFDAEVDIGDHWDEGTQHYQIDYVYAPNGYEVKAGGVTHGSKPDHG